MVAENELDVLERVGRKLADRIQALRGALLAISRNRAGGTEAAELAARALRDDATAGGWLDDIGTTTMVDPDVACIRCKLRERQPGSMWCRFCEPARHGRY